MHGKVGPKRQRTMQVSCVKLFGKTTHGGHTCNTPVPHRPGLHLEQFQELDSEMTSKGKLSKDVFAYFLLKQTTTCRRFDLGEVLKPIKKFLLPTPAQIADNDPSKVYYIELLDEVAFTRARSQSKMNTFLSVLASRLYQINENACPKRRLLNPET